MVIRQSTLLGSYERTIERPWHLGGTFFTQCFIDIYILGNVPKRAIRIFALQVFGFSYLLDVKLYKYNSCLRLRTEPTPKSPKTPHQRRSGQPSQKSCHHEDGLSLVVWAHDVSNMRLGGSLIPKRLRPKVYGLSRPPFRQSLMYDDGDQGAFNFARRPFTRLHHIELNVAVVACHEFSTSNDARDQKSI